VDRPWAVFLFALTPERRKSLHAVVDLNSSSAVHGKHDIGNANGGDGSGINPQREHSA
jgi:hypothetical protein